jgi:hypothetical protein
MNLNPDDFAEMVVTTIKKSLEGPLVKGRFESLEQRIAALEIRPVPTFRGPHEESKAYPSNSLVTHLNTLWVSAMSTTSVPGTDPSWRLASREAMRE